MVLMLYRASVVNHCVQFHSSELDDHLIDLILTSARRKPQSAINLKNRSSQNSLVNVIDLCLVLYCYLGLCPRLAVTRRVVMQAGGQIGKLAYIDDQTTTAQVRNGQQTNKGFIWVYFRNRSFVIFG